MYPIVILLRVQRLSTWLDKELSEGGELAKALDSVKDSLKGPTISNPSKTFNSMAARWINRKFLPNLVVPDLTQLIQSYELNLSNLPNLT